jgi:predicted Zn-dependent protease
MAPTALNQPIQSEKLQKAFNLMAAKKLDAAEAELNEGITESEKAKDKVMEALFCSTLGILYKLKNESRKAWRQYHKAEKLLPHEPSLKLISARLLIETFHQYDTAIKKAQKVLKTAKHDRPFSHHAQTTLGLAYLKKGDKNRALKCLSEAMEGDFEGMISAANIDLKLLEALLIKKTGYEECRAYLEKALSFAKKMGEENNAKVIAWLLENFPKEF